MDIRVLAGMAAAIAVLMAAGPAAAQTTTWSTVDFYEEPGLNVVQTAQGEYVLSDANTYTVSLACTATAPQAAGIGVTDCYIEGADGSRYSTDEDDSTPGSTDASVRRDIVIPRQEHRVCVGSRAMLMDFSTFVSVPVGCSIFFSG